MGSAASIIASKVVKLSSKYLYNEKIEDKNNCEEVAVDQNLAVDMTEQTQNLQYGVHYQLFKTSLEAVNLLSRGGNGGKDLISALHATERELPYIRLLNKEKFLQQSLIIDCICDIQQLIQEIHLQYDDSLQQWKCFPTTQFWSSLKAFMSHRESIEKLLLWNCDQCDNIFEMFDSSECPDYSFLSHLYTPTTRVGLHGELIMYLAHCQHPYIWFDVGCLPLFEPDNARTIVEADMMKLQQRRNFFSKRAASFQAYYIMDGLMKPTDLERLQEADELDEFTPTMGLLSLCLLLENRLRMLPMPPKIDYSRLMKDIQDHNVILKNNLLSIYDDIMTTKFMKPMSLGSFLPCTSAWLPLSILPRDATSESKNIVEYLTSDLYAMRYLPAIFSTETFYCLDPLTGRWIPGITLPNMQSLATAPSFLTPYPSSDLPVTSFGWTYYKEAEIWLLNLSWKQSGIDGEITGDICLHLHHKCVISSREKVVMFNPSKSKVQAFSTVSQDDKQTNISFLDACATLPCLICRRVINSSSSSQLLSQLISSEWICSYCHWINDGNLTECIKCNKSELRVEEDIYDERDFHVGDRVHICYRDHMSPVGYISHVYKSEMYDVMFLDKIEKYIDKELLIHEGNRNKQRKQSMLIDQVYRPCGVCCYMNLSTEEYCQLCSIKLSKIVSNQSSDYLFSVGTKVLVQILSPESIENNKQDQEERGMEVDTHRIHCIYEPALIKEIHRYGLYTVELLSTGKILRFIHENLISILGPSSEIHWTCANCQTSNTSYFSLNEKINHSQTSTIMKCHQCHQIKSNISSNTHHRQFHYVENASMMLGAKVEARYHGGEIYYPGVIRNITTNGLYVVEYDHGEIETDIPEESIVVIAIYCGPFGV